MAYPIKREGKLFRKYAVLFVTLVSGTLLVSGLLEIFFSYQENKAALTTIQREKAISAASKIEQFVNKIEVQLAWIAPSPWGAAGATSEERRHMEYLRLLRREPAITQVRYLDSSGKEQLCVSRLGMDIEKSGVDFSRDAAFMGAKSGKTYFSNAYFRKGSEPYMTMAIAGPRKKSGVTMADVNLKFVWDVVTQIKVGKAGHAYVVGSGGNLLAHTDISQVLRKTDLSSLPQVAGVRENPTQVDDDKKISVSRDLNGRLVLTAYAPIKPVGWFIFLEQPLKEAFEPLYTSILRAVLLILAGITLSIVASLILAKSMVKPIRTIQEGAGRIASGNLEHRIDVNTGDMLETLAEDFNQMTSKLRESYVQLEEKVEARTRELKEALEKLEIAGKHKSEFLANMSHELRTPLNAILGYTELILDKIYGDVPEKIHEVLERLEQNGRHLLNLINDVLDLSKIEAGRLALSLNDYSMPDLVQTVITAVESLAAEKNLGLKAKVSSDLTPGKGDEHRIAQVFLNLIGNAIKFTEEGEVRVEVNTSDGLFLVSVIDTGPGLSEEDQKSIFDEFRQVDGSSTKEKGGTGLGLSISKKIVEMHGGSIWAESTLGEGSTFWFSLPIRVEQQKEQ